MPDYIFKPAEYGVNAWGNVIFKESFIPEGFTNTVYNLGFTIVNNDSPVYIRAFLASLEDF